MAIADFAHAGGGAAEMHAGVIEPVGEDERLGAEHAPVEQRLQDRSICLKAGGHDQCRGLLLQRGDLGLDSREQLEVAGDEARGAGPHAIARRPFFGTFDQRRMKPQAQIVVAGEIDEGSPPMRMVLRVRASTGGKAAAQTSARASSDMLDSGFRFLP